MTGHELYADGHEGWIECTCGERFWTTAEWDAHRDVDGHAEGRIPDDQPLWGS